MAKFNETSQEASLGVPLQKYNKGSWLINNNNNNNNNKIADFLFCFENISETSCPNWMKLYRKLPRVTLYKWNHKGSRLINNNNNNEMANFLFCFKTNISSKTTCPNSMKFYRKLPWVTFYKNITRDRDWSTTTTIWPTSCFAFKKHLWNYQARFTETLQEASLHDSFGLHS